MVFFGQSVLSPSLKTCIHTYIQAMIWALLLTSNELHTMTSNWAIKIKPTLLICTLSNQGQHWGLETSQYSISPPTRRQTSLLIYFINGGNGRNILFELIIEEQWSNTDNVALSLRDKTILFVSTNKSSLILWLRRKNTNVQEPEKYELMWYLGNPTPQLTSLYKKGSCSWYEV